MTQKYDCDRGDTFELLGEEAAEVIKEVFKVKRFGAHPEGRAPGYKGEPAIDQLHQEIGDFLAVLEIAVDEGKISSSRLLECVDRKHARLNELFGCVRPHGYVTFDR